MSCVLRLLLPGPLSAAALGALRPYRAEGRDGGRVALHCDVSAAGFDALPAQVADAIAFLRAHAADLRRLTGAGAAGVLDFAVEASDAAAHSTHLPVELVRAAAAVGIALEVTRYAVADPMPEGSRP